MNHTQNYSLNQWEKTDRLRMDDFNADNAKLDAALKSNADAISAETAARTAALKSKADTSALTALQAQIAACGNCRIVTGTYTGSGKYGSGNKNTLTFNQKPLVLFVAGGGHNLLAIYASTHASVFYAAGTDAYFGCPIQWSETGASWYHESYPSYQMNTSGTTYQYVALLASN